MFKNGLVLIFMFVLSLKNIMQMINNFLDSLALEMIRMLIMGAGPMHEKAGISNKVASITFLRRGGGDKAQFRCHLLMKIEI